MQTKQQSIKNPQQYLNRHRKWIQSLQNISQIQQYPRNQKLLKNKKIYAKSINYLLEHNQNLLKQRKRSNVSFQMKKKRTNISSIQQKYIQSQMQLKKVNFHHKKIQINKNSVLRKQFKNKNKGEKEVKMKEYKFDLDEIKRYNSSLIFGIQASNLKENKSLQRIKNTLILSRKSIKSLYEHVQQIRAKKKSQQPIEEIVLKSSRKGYKIGKMKKDFSLYNSRQLSISQMTQKGQISLQKINKIGRYIDENNVETNNTSQQTSKRQHRHDIQQQMTRINQKQRKQIQIVSKNLKKLIYGGNSVNDYSFNCEKTGNMPHKYMQIAVEQQQILSKFKGELKNKRKLLQKFNNIMTNFKKHDKLFSPGHKDVKII